MLIVAATGVGLLLAGLFFSFTGRRSTGRPPTRQILIAVARVLLYVVLAIEAAVILTRIDSGVARIVVSILVVLGVAWSVVRALRSPTPVRALGVLGITLGVSLVMVVVLGALVGGGAEQPALALPASTITDPAGDCDCEAAYDVRASGSDIDGTVWVSVGDVVPQGARFWIWTAADPYTPMELTRTEGSWTVLVSEGSEVNARDVVAVEMADGIHLRFGTDIGAFAVVSEQGDRAPDTGYAGGAGVVASNELDERYQYAYGELSEAHRALAVLLAGSMLATGEFTYDVGISADPDVKRSGTLRIQDGSVEFQLTRTGTHGGHTDGFSADGDTVCIDEAAEPCAPMWVNPFAAFDDVVTAPKSVQAVALESREVLGEEVICVGITDAGSSVLHEGEFCSFSDGTLAFVDDRTFGMVAVLESRTTGGDA